MASVFPPIGRRGWLAGLAATMLHGATPACAAIAGADPRRIMVIGDSQAEGLATGLETLLRRDRTYRVLDRSKIATGLLSVTAFDWPAHVQSLAAKEHADVAVVMFGANDRPGVRVGGHVDTGLTRNFRQGYGARVRNIVQTLTQAHMAVIWVGHPIVRDPTFAEDMAMLNTIFATEAVAAGARFLPLWDVFQGPDHLYAAYGPDIEGQTTRLRADDGVHLTRAGYEVVAKLLRPLIDAHTDGLAAAGRVNRG